MARIALADLDAPEAFPLYAETCLKIKPKKGGTIPLLLNVTQKRIHEARMFCLANDRPPRIAILKARQTGGSTVTQAMGFHACHLRPGRKFTVLAHTKESAEILFDMSRHFYENLPATARPPAAYFTKTDLVFDHNGSRIQIAVADERGARGITSQYLHLSEFAYMRDPIATLDAAMNAVPAQADSLVIVESTACGMNAFHDLWVAAKSGQNDFIPVFVPWFDEPSYRRTAKFTEQDLDDDERSLVSRFRLSLEQLAWRRYTIRNSCGGDIRRFKQEFPCTDTEAFLVSGSPVFTDDAIEWHNQHVPPGTAEVPIEITSLPPACDIVWDEREAAAVTTEPYAGGPFRIYRPRQPRNLYIAAFDPSEGDPGSDPSPGIMLNRMTLQIDAVWWGRRRPDRLAHTAYCMCQFFGGEEAVTAIWESNNHGLAFQLEFEKLYNNFYWRESSQESVSKKVTDKPGYNTNVKSKALLWNRVRVYIDDKMAPIRCPLTVAELGNVYYDMMGGQRVVKNYDGKTKDLLVCLGLALECHAGSAEAELLPLSDDDFADLISLRRESYIAQSMGIEGMEPQQILDRVGATARDLEELDEREHDARERNRVLGLGDPT